jgi:hypothetical protein
VVADYTPVCEICHVDPSKSIEPSCATRQIPNFIEFHRSSPTRLDRNCS